MLKGLGCLWRDVQVITPPSPRWGYTDLALCGALAGAMLVLALIVWNMLSGRFDASDPFIQVMAETMGSASAGAILSVLLSLIHCHYRQRM
jgi:hypothetical protein